MSDALMALKRDRQFFPERQFEIGQKVRVRENYRYADDWRGEFIVTGLEWKYQGIGHINISIASMDEINDRNGSTDGFSSEDLEAVHDAPPKPEGTP